MGGKGIIPAKNRLELSGIHIQSAAFRRSDISPVAEVLLQEKLPLLIDKTQRARPGNLRGELAVTDITAFRASLYLSRKFPLVFQSPSLFRHLALLTGPHPQGVSSPGLNPNNLVIAADG